MSLLESLKEALLRIDNHVCYGKCFDSFTEEHGWNIIVFDRESIKKKNRDIYRVFNVYIVRENCIDEGLDIKIIKEVEKSTTLKLINDKDMQYNYIRKGDTDDVVEILTLSFAKTEICQV